MIGTILDIAERKRMEDKLRTLSCGIEQSPVSIVITDREGNIEYVNPKFTRLTGYTSDEAIGQNPRILKSGKIPAEVHQQLWETILSCNEWHGEFCNKKKNGELYWESASISPITDSDGNITHFIAVKEDITERKQMEEELAKNTRLAELRAEIGETLGLNQGLKVILQRCSELLAEYLDVAFFRIWTLNEAEQVLEMQASAGMYTHINGPHGRVPVGMFKIGMIASERLPHLTNDVQNDPRIGDKEWAQREKMVAFAGYPLIIADRLVGVMATFARTTIAESILEELGTVAGRIAQCVGRKQTETDNNRLAAILNATTDLVGIADPAGKLVYLNRAGRNLLGVDLDEDISKTFIAEYIPNPGSHPSLTEGIPSAIRDGQWSGEVNLVSRRGQEIPVSQVILVHKTPDGKLEFISTIMRDITERKAADNTLKMKNAEIEQFTYAVSHDLRSPLVTVKTFLG